MNEHPSNGQPALVGVSGRQFAGFAAAVLVFIVDAEERLLLLAHPRRPEHWQVVSGGIEAGETVLEAALRETHEEIGADAALRPLGTVHTFTFCYDESVSHMIDVCYLMAYEGGPIEPGDDMAGSECRWWTLDELTDDSVQLAVPRDQKWLMGRAVELYRLWKDQEVNLQPAPGTSAYSAGNVTPPGPGRRRNP